MLAAFRQVTREARPASQRITLHKEETLMSKLYLLRTSRLFVLFVSMAVLLVPIAPKRNAATAGGISFPSSKASPHLAREQEGPSKLYSSYWYLDQATTSVLEITNNGEVSQVVTPTLLVRGSEHLSLDPVTVPSHATRSISLNKALKSRINSGNDAGGDRRWGDGSRIGSLWGSATLLCESADDITSKILSEDPKESLAVHSGFYEYGSGSLSSMWWLPTKKSVALLALQNATYRETSVRTILYLDGRVVSGPRLSLPPGGSRLFDLRDLVPKSISKKLPQVGAIRFVSEGDSQALLGRAVLFDEQLGFSVPLKMHSLFVHITNTLQLAGAPFGRPDKKMGFPKSARFTTQLLLTNTSSKSIEATVTLDGKNTEGGPVSSDLPVVEIPALQSRVVDLDALRINSHSPIADGYAGVRLTHTGSGVELIAEAITVDRTLQFSFDNAIYDNDSLPAVYNAISFDLTGNKDTLLLVKNPSNTTIKFGYRLNYEKQSVMQRYTSKLSELKPYELRVVDLRAIRGSRVPDGQGSVLPADVEFGNANIFSNQPILSGDPNFDPVAGISSSCISPCGIGYEGRERCPFVSCPGCEPCEWHPELCEGACPNTCTPCLIIRGEETAACLRGLALLEGLATSAYLIALHECDNQAVCQEDSPGFDQEECDHCKNNALAAFLVAQAAFTVIFVDCLRDRTDCSGTTRTDCSLCN